MAPPCLHLQVVQWASYINALDNVGGYIDWHSYGQYILGAWGYTNTLPVHYAQQVSRVGEDLVEFFVGGVTTGRPQNVSKSRAVTLRILKTSHRDFYRSHVTASTTGLRNNCTLEKKLLTGSKSVLTTK